ncbi:sigma-54 interaction domain-containing protein [Schnuerera ultunensis]|uniref:Arginine utilization regulatory protein RocR n=1 Tax=[Clostridium] ultunense Esp TaxID=1288971 RepID=A0A1M4PL69_9FIRM|nr:sigma-54-dependent Fis family transcriptional regulator [Schnuerera ultunensis]SHD76189.1 Arginine utilization regulatory protein RocR [[Clostridium] ultunense Esp]
MLKKSLENLPKLFNYADFFVVTDKDGYIEFYKVYRSLGSKIVENPVGLHILELHQHLNEETSTIMRVLRTGEPIINEKQYLNIFKERTVTVLTTTLPIMAGNEVIGAIDINRYFDVDLRKVDEHDIKDNFNYSDLFFTIDDILTSNPAMIEVKNKTLKAAKTNSPVMIYGETGTGKDLIAQAIHNHSFRKHNPFIVQNCSAIPLTLGEGIFFGTTRGSFTGAENKMGLFEMADGGTLVLDELNSMDINLQSKLLRATESSVIRRIGGAGLIYVDVRLISILNEDPYFVIKQNKMRRDLFYRMGVVLIHVPPLRERKEDIPLLVNSFIEEYNLKMDKNIKGVNKQVMDLFMEYSWPGNVRELKHVIESAFNFAEEEIIDGDQLPDHIKYQSKTKESAIDIDDKFCLNTALKDFEIKYIKLALESSDTLNEAAKLLKISRQTLKYKMDTYGIEIE